MGIRNGNQCYCGNNENYYRNGLCSNTGCICDEPCEGNNQPTGCGGYFAISIYQISKLLAQEHGGYTFPTPTVYHFYNVTLQEVILSYATLFLPWGASRLLYSPQTRTQKLWTDEQSRVMNDTCTFTFGKPMWANKVFSKL